MSSDPNQIRSRLAEALDAEEYNRLIGSVQEVQKRGRLRFWQQELLGKAGVAISTVQEFIHVLDGADPIPIPSEPWTREVFLGRIEKFPYGDFPIDETPPEWMAAAWEIDSVRNELTSEMARTVSKIGELAYTTEYLNYLSQSLPIDRQVELFNCIRDRSPHREDEFRPGFERAFPDCVPHLPPPMTMKEGAERLGVTEEEYRRLCFPRGADAE